MKNFIACLGMTVAIAVETVGDVIQIAGAGITWAGLMVAKNAAKVEGNEHDIKYFEERTKHLFQH